MTEAEKSGTKVVFMAGKRVMELGQFTRFSPGTCLVAYVDLLGFKEMIVKDPGGKDLVPLLEESLSAGLSFAKRMRDTTEQLRYRRCESPEAYQTLNWTNEDAPVEIPSAIPS